MLFLFPEGNGRKGALGAIFGQCGEGEGEGEETARVSAHRKGCDCRKRSRGHPACVEQWETARGALFRIEGCRVCGLLSCLSLSLCFFWPAVQNRFSTTRSRDAPHMSCR